ATAIESALVSPRLLLRFSRFEKSRRLDQDLALRGVGYLLLRLRHGEPADFVDFVVVARDVALQKTEQIKTDPLENPDGFAGAALLRVPIGDIVQFCNNFAVEARLFAHFAQRGILERLPFFHLPFGKSPTVAHADQRDLYLATVLAKDDAARRNHADGRPGRCRVTFWRFLHPATGRTARCLRRSAAR